MRASKAMFCFRTLALLSIAAQATLISVTAAAEQDAEANTAEAGVAAGTRQKSRGSIALKRLSKTIVDGLLAEEIGDMLALPIGDALEGLDQFFEPRSDFRGVVGNLQQVPS